MSADAMAGGCACGRVRFSAAVADDEAYLCHCRMCQRATGSISIAFKNLKQADVAWESEPDWYESSPIAKRPYCRECGTSLGFQFKDGENMDLTVAAFDDPSRFKPRDHFGAESMHRAWIKTDGLPEYRTDERPSLTAGSRPPESSPASAISEHRWTASDGVELVWREMGEGRPAVLLHGLFSDADMNWIRFGHAATIAAKGFRLIMPDLRAHGLSAKPHDPACYPPGILGRDLAELVAHLKLVDFDLGGFSLGTRTTVDAVAGGLKPRRAILAGMGLEGLQGWARRKRFFLDAIASFETSDRGDPHWLAIQFMKTMKVDKEAAALLLESFRDMEPDALAAFTMPTLVVCGEKDHDNGSPQALADALPNGELRLVPGTHMSSVTEPAFGEAVAEFLAA